MMRNIRDIDEGTIRRIDWRELLPGTLILRGLTLSLRLAPILLGVLLLVLVVLAAERFSAAPFFSIPTEFSERFDASLQGMNRFFRLEGQILTAKNLFAFFVSALLTGFFGLALGRSAAVRIASSERSGFAASFRFACRKFRSVLLAVSIPLGGIALFELMTILAVRFLPSALFLTLYPFFLLLSYWAALLALGLFFGFPLMIAAAAVDRCDGFDAFSRTFSYIFQRPIHFLFYIVCAVLLGEVGFQIVKLAAWITGLLCPEPASVSLMAANPFSHWGLFWRQVLWLTPYGFLWSCYIVSGTAIYFILRRSVDGTPFEDFSPNVQEAPRRLPPLEPVPETPSASSDEPHGADDSSQGAAS